MVAAEASEVKEQNSVRQLFCSTGMMQRELFFNRVQSRSVLLNAQLTNSCRICSRINPQGNCVSWAVGENLAQSEPKS